jgi:SAM-dependent methyltransferase
MVNPVAWYEANAAAVSARYEEVSAQAVHAWLLDLLPSLPAAVLDVGAGSGRDAAWLAARGYDVVAVEPWAAMRAAAQARHPEAGIRWLADRLPGLEHTLKTGLSFDLILLSAVWMHVAPIDRTRAFRKLITLLKPGGILAITLRHGPAEDARGMRPVSVAEIEALERKHGTFVVRLADTDDTLGREVICRNVLDVENRA